MATDYQFVPVELPGAWLNSILVCLKKGFAFRRHFTVFVVNRLHDEAIFKLFPAGAYVTCARRKNQIEIWLQGRLYAPQRP